jgi:hypothetical protein
MLLGILNSQAAGGGVVGDYNLLETVELSTNTTSVTFSGIGNYSDYKHLQIRAVLKSNQPAYTSAVKVVFNGFTSTGQWSHFLGGDGSSAYSNASNSSGTIINYTSGSSGSSWSSWIMDILDFSNTNKTTTTRSLVGQQDSTANIALNSSNYYQTTAVTSFVISEDTGNSFLANSRFSLYGSK